MHPAAKDGSMRGGATFEWVAEELTHEGRRLEETCRVLLRCGKTSGPVPRHVVLTQLDALETHLGRLSEHLATVREVLDQSSLRARVLSAYGSRLPANVNRRDTRPGMDIEP